MSTAKKIVIVPENGQISIGKAFAGKAIQIETVEAGLLITTGTFIPDHQQIFYTPKANERLNAFDRHVTQSEPEKSADEILELIDSQRTE